MGAENLAEWQWTGWIELETVRATIEAYGKGLIALPRPREKANGKYVRHAGQSTDQHPYTTETVAQFLGWTRKDGKGVRPDHSCTIAFLAVDALDEGLIKESDLIGLDLGHIHELIRGMRRIAATEREEARLQREQAEASQRPAAEAKSAPERARHERRAEVFEAQARPPEPCPSPAPARAAQRRPRARRVRMRTPAPGPDVASG
jgi:hypothetical protein